MAEEQGGGSGGVVWILVDHSAREAAYDEVARQLRERGVQAECVTITEMIGQVARDTLAGGAERLLRGLRVAFQGRSSDEDLIGAVRTARPDILAVTNARYVRALSLLENLSGIRSLQVGLLPDYSYTSAWLRSSLGAFVVPHDELRQRLARDGFDPERVLVGGPAIGQSFTQQIDRDEARQAFGFGSARPVVLVRSETFEVGSLEKLVFQSTLVDRDARFIFHHNGDGTAASTLRRAADQYQLSAVMFGRVDDLERYVAACDAVIVAPQEPLVPELLAAGRPLCFVGQPQEGALAEQIDFLKREGVARHVGDILRLGAEIDRLLEPQTLSEATEAAGQIGLSSGSREVAEALMQALEERDRWLQPAGTRQQPPHEEPGGDGAEGQGGEGEAAGGSGGGAFETIGGDTGGDQQRQDGGSGGGGGGRGAAGGDGEPSYGRLSKAEAKEQLAALIMSEREIERKLGEIERQQDRWRNRLELAREWGEEDLAGEAEDILRGHLEEARPLQQDLADIRRQKEKLKRAALGDRYQGGEGGSEGEGDGPRGSRLAELEQRFRKMEIKSDLDGLKDRMRRELGEDE